MVADDEPDMRKMIGAIVKRAYPEAQVDVFVNGKQAWEAVSVSGKDYCLLITDLQMPEMDGFELSSKVSEAFPEMKIIMMSGNPDLAAGAKVHALLAKPISPDDILKTIRTQISG